MPTGTRTAKVSTNILSIRLTPEEKARYTEIWQKARKKYPYITKSDLIRELVGLTKNLVVTDSDIRYFKTGNR